MRNVTKTVAKALAYHWGELQERHPDLTHELMTGLTTALAAAQTSGDGKRAERLDEVLDILAEGIVKCEHPTGRDLGDVLERTIAGIRTYYYLVSCIPRAEKRVSEMLKKERRVSAGVPLDRGSTTLN